MDYVRNVGRSLLRLWRRLFFGERSFSGNMPYAHLFRRSRHGCPTPDRYGRMAALFLGSGILAHGMDVKLAWDANMEEDLEGYRVYYWQVGGFSTPKTNSFETKTNSCTITNLIAGRRYHFYVTAFNTSQLESLPSNYVTNEVANPDRAVVNQGGWTSSLANGATNLLANDLLLPNRDYSDKVVLIDRPQKGEVELHQDGTFSYHHYGGADDQDSFSYGIRSGSEINAKAWVTISIFRLSQVQVTGDGLLIEFNSDISSTYKLEWNFESPWKNSAWTNSKTIKRADSGGIGVVPFHLPEHALKDQVFYRLNYESVGTNISIGPFGFLTRKILPGWNYLGTPFHSPPSYHGRVKAVSRSAIAIHEKSLPPESFRIVNGTYQAILILVKSAQADLEGQWWPINYNTDDTLHLYNRGNDLTSVLFEGDIVEIRNLISLQDVFKDFRSGESLLRRNDDTPEYSIEANWISYLDPISLLDKKDASTNYSSFLYYSGTQALEGYYQYFNNDFMYGPLDRSWMTLFPGQAFRLYTERSDLAVRFCGMVETGPFMHYINPGYNFVTSVYPVTIPLTESGLIEPSWNLDELLWADSAILPSIGYYLKCGEVGPFKWVQRPPLAE